MNTLNISVLNTRANAEGISFAAIKAAIVECGDALRSHGVTHGPFKVGLADLPRYNSLYRHMVLDAAPGVQPWEEITSPFPAFAWGAVYEFHLESRWMAMKNGAQFTIENDTTTWWCRKIDNESIVIDKIYDMRHEEWEQSCMLFLPTGIRAAVAKKVGADLSSSTFHAAFDAVADSLANY